jgi:hypothetical protein
MKNSSERLVVFVTPAQKRAIANTAHELGISVSELLRRAVLAFDATADQVRAARIVDNWAARRAPDALNETLRRIAGASAQSSPACPSATGAAPGLRLCEPAAPADPADRARTIEPVQPGSVQPTPISRGLPVAAAVAHALALTGEPRGGSAACDEENPCLDEQTVARLTTRWAAAHDAGNAPAFTNVAPIRSSRRAGTGS